LKNCLTNIRGSENETRAAKFRTIDIRLIFVKYHGLWICEFTNDRRREGGRSYSSLNFFYWMVLHWYKLLPAWVGAMRIWDLSGIVIYTNARVLKKNLWLRFQTNCCRGFLIRSTQNGTTNGCFMFFFSVYVFFFTKWFEDKWKVIKRPGYSQYRHKNDSSRSDETTTRKRANCSSPIRLIAV